MTMLLADRALAQRLERNEGLNTADYARALQQIQPGSGAQVMSVAGGYATFSRPEFPINRAIGLGMTQPVTADDLDTVESFYRGYGLPAKVDLCPLADPTLAAELGRRCYRIATFFNVQIRPIRSEDAALTAGSEIRVAPVGSHQEAELWAITMARSGSPLPEVAADDPWLALARIATQRPGVICFLAWIGDDLAGGAALMVRDGLASLFSTTTLPSFRNRGVQTALIRERLAFAARAGCDLITVATLPGNQSQRNVQRAGFQVVYTRLVMTRDLA